MPLNPSQQRTIATWAIKTAMVTESIADQKREHFYTRSERQQLRTSLAIPARTSVWLGRYSGISAISMKGTDAWTADGDPIPVQGHVNTIFFGNLIIQVMTFHVQREDSDAPIRINPKPGPWDKGLISIWPPHDRVMNWPPPLTFRDGSIRALMTRFSTGIDRNA